MRRRKHFVLILLVLVPLLVFTSALERAGWWVTRFFRLAGWNLG